MPEVRMYRFVPFAVAAALACAPDRQALAQEDPRAVIGRAVQASGGEEKLARLKAVRIKTSGTVQINGAASPFTGETTAELPGHIKNVLTCDLKGQKHTLTQLITPERVAVRVDDKEQELKDLAALEMRELLYAEQVNTLLPLLRDSRFELKLVGQSRIKDRPVVAVRVTAEGHKPIVLYFDQATGLLAKVLRPTVEPATGREVVQEEFYGDYRTVEGLQRPMKVVVLKDGKQFLDGTVTEVKYPERFEDDTFTLP
jgi:hypothetical protein